MFKGTYTIHETDGLRTELFEDKNGLYRGRIVAIYEDSEQIIFTGIKGHENYSDAHALVTRLASEFEEGLSERLGSAHTDNVELLKDFTELQQKYNRLDHSVEQKDEALKTKVEIAENQAHYERKITAHWRLWSIVSWCLTAAVWLYAWWFV